MSLIVKNMVEEKINFAAIEKKWQDKWEKAKIFEAKENSAKKKYYALEMFPYPSGSGLHMGHAWNYSIGDILARFKTMQGFNVLHPMGYDALGLPAENAAIKDKVHPEDYTNNSIKNFIKQQKNLGLSYDWSRMLNTASPDYYKWDQWIFLKMFEKGLAYQKDATVNWCPKCDTVLANEQAQGGTCDRCATKVEIKRLNQWFFKITDYADRLLEGHKKLNWPERTIAMQKNWIGKSHGTEINFLINNKKWPIFTTRPDTIFGVTFMVVSAQHKDLMNLVSADQEKSVEKFLKKLKSVSEKEIDMEKEGVFTGSYAINPANGEKVPVYAGNFVVADYGAGMVMAVPAHDQRDFEFAKKYNIPIKVVIQPDAYEINAAKMSRAYTSDGKLVDSGEFNGMNNREAIEEITKWLVKNGAGKKVVNFKLRDWCISRQRYWGTPIPIIHCEKCGEKITKESKTINFHEQSTWKRLISGEKTIETRALNPEEKERYFGDIKKGSYLKAVNKETNEVEYFLVKSVSKFDNLKKLFENKEVLRKVYAPNIIPKNLDELERDYSYKNDYVNKINKNGLIAWEVEKIIPGVIPIAEKDLPVKLPKEVKFGKGNPLLTNEKWINVKCPRCGGKAKRETDTMDTFVNSSWYFLRYCDPHNSKEIFDKKKVKYWMPVDTYIGGAEHACMHLIYCRFYTMFLHDLGLIDFDEPTPRLFHQGMLRAVGGEKMSKSKGNVISPEFVSDRYGIDTARFFLCSLASPDKDIDWDENGINGSLRFINKIFDSYSKIKIGKSSSELESKLNETIKNVGEYIENFEYRKATIELRELFDLIAEQKEASKDSLEKSLKLISPFCPHITEELWEKLGNNKNGKNFISLSEWPKADLSKIKKKNELGDLNEKVSVQVKEVLSKLKEHGMNYKKVFLYVVPFELGKYNLEKLKKLTGVEVKIYSVTDEKKHDPENKSKKAIPGRPGIYVE